MRGLTVAAITIPPADLCFTDDFLSFFYLNVTPLIDNGWKNCNAYCCININKKITTAKNLVNFGQETLHGNQFLSHETATGWHLTPLLFVSAFHNSREDHRTYTHMKTPNEPSTPGKNLVNFSAVNH